MKKTKKKGKRFVYVEKKKYLEEFNPPKKELVKKFPEVEEELIDEIFSSVNRNFKEAEKILEEMTYKPPVLPEIDPLDEYEFPEEDINSLDICQYYTFNYFSDEEEVTPQEDVNKLDEFNLFEFIETLTKIFAYMPQEEITNLLCDNDFDVEKVVEILMEKTDEKERAEMKNIDIGFIAEMNHNVFNNKFNEAQLLKQAEIQQELLAECRKDNVKSKLDLKNIKREEFPSLGESSSSENEEASLEEDFWETPIANLKSKRARSDLTQLAQKYFNVDEFHIKMVYSSYMNYKETDNFLRKEANKTKTASKTAETKVNTNTSLSKLLSKKRVNMAEYAATRKKMIVSSVMAWQRGDIKNSKRLLKDAKKFKEDMMKSVKDRNIEVFVKNNSDFSISYSGKKHMKIDLHGLSLAESKKLVSKILDKCSKGKKLTLITGRGLHSKDNKPVLYPKIQQMLRDRNVRFEPCVGYIEVTV